MLVLRHISIIVSSYHHIISGGTAMTNEVKSEGADTRTIADELKELGKQLSAALKAVWESEERQELQREISEGLLALGEQIEEAVKTAHESEAFQEAKTDVEQAVAKAKQSDAAQNVRQGLLDGLQSINRELGKLASTPKAKAAEATEGEDDEPAAAS
jgi:hypothetical protein